MADPFDGGISQRPGRAFIKSAKFSRSGFIVNADGSIGDATNLRPLCAIAASGGMAPRVLSRWRAPQTPSGVACADAVSA
jgi:hypothetical protein